MKERGVTIIECVIAIAIFSIVSGVGLQIYRSSFDQAAKTADTTKAIFLSEEGIEALRSIRDVNFSSLTDGPKGLTLSGNIWTISGTSDTVDKFNRVTTISSVDADTKNATTTVSWSYKGATSSVALGTVLTNWHKSIGASQYTTIDTSLANLSLLSGSRLLTGMFLTTDGTLATTTITKVQVTWTTASRTMQQVRSPNLTSVYTGSVASNTLVTLTTPIVIAGAATRSFELYYSAAMTGATFTITFTFSDATTKSVTITNPPTGV